MGESSFSPEMQRSIGGGLAGWVPQVASGPATGRTASAFPSSPRNAEDPVAHVALRLQRRLERQLELLGRLQAAEQHPEEAAGLAELLEATRQLRHDSEGLLLLCGADPGFGRDGPRTVSDVLSDAVAAAQEPWRVELRPAPSATLVPRAAGELRHLLAEVLDHALSVSRTGARIDVVSRVAGDGAMTVEVTTDAVDEEDADRGPRRAGPAVAERLAQRSGTAIRLQHPLGGVDPETGLVASLHCPRALMSLTEAAPSAAPRDRAGTARPADVRRDAGLWSLGGLRPAADPEPAMRTPAGRLGPAVSPADDLFGSLLDRRDAPADDPVGTPIFEAIASAWFREDDGRDTSGDKGSGSGEPLDWETPHDAEWRAANARAASPETGPMTASGLPRRRPGTQLVPPPRAQGVRPETGPGERVPDRVRERLATYQRGLQEGRHRATEPAPPEPASTESDDVEAWWSKPEW
ncbi:hypothetical protein [Pseudonocardia acidicola]|uniref:histidine kinase n=1 Tax=Pseudonocardia acidicola TaxID=2724939 RepID=A0ABX1SFV9_9PSEU|nr:hypothetical protein [Pseudonocardia acidicola]NMH99975.1 hypothetical protein [Pseudonocardia acidicola]